MPEVFINNWMLFFFIYKSSHLLNHAWDSHTIGQFGHLAKIVFFFFFINTAAFIVL